MMKKVRNRLRPMITWFGGMVGVPMALRTKLKTMTMRVNAVVSIRIAGATLSTVSSARI